MIASLKRNLFFRIIVYNLIANLMNNDLCKMYAIILNYRRRESIKLKTFEFSFQNCLGLIYTVYMENMQVELETLIGNILGFYATILDVHRLHTAVLDVPALDGILADVARIPGLCTGRWCTSRY